MQRSRLVSGCALALGVVSPGLALGFGPTVIFSNIAASPTSDVPGIAGAKFNPGTSTQFDRPFVSPDGSRWIFAGIADSAGTDLDVIILGSGVTNAGATLGVKEGDAMPGDTPTYVTLGTQMGINNAGQYAFKKPSQVPPVVL